MADDSSQTDRRKQEHTATAIERMLTLVQEADLRSINASRMLELSVLGSIASSVLFLLLLTKLCLGDSIPGVPFTFSGSPSSGELFGFGIAILVMVQQLHGWLKTFQRERRYISRVVRFLQEAVRPDDFPTQLEWFHFKMRLERYDIALPVIRQLTPTVRPPLSLSKPESTVGS